MQLALILLLEFKYQTLTKNKIHIIQRCIILL